MDLAEYIGTQIFRKARGSASARLGGNTAAGQGQDCHDHKESTQLEYFNHTRFFLNQVNHFGGDERNKCLYDRLTQNKEKRQYRSRFIFSHRPCKSFEHDAFSLSFYAVFVFEDSKKLTVN